MGFVKKDEMLQDSDGRPYTVIGAYRVVKNSEHMTGVYLYNDGENRLITSNPKWTKAVKIAQLLDEAFNEGKEKA